MDPLASFQRGARPALAARLRAETLDLLVVGGGITGASLFRDAALRGLRVALVDAKDFAAGTSSRSSKMVHGGLRYLKTFGFGLAREACLERNLHMRLNKRLVRPQSFLYPLYAGRGEPRWKTRLALLAYEALSNFSNHRLHWFLSREQTLLRAPGVPIDGLEGGCMYWDAVTSDSRWTLEVVKDGVRAGGVALNHAPVARLLSDGDRIAGAALEDRATGCGEIAVRARAVVNATGVFADRLRAMEDPDAAPLVRLSKGTHLVFGEEDVPLTMSTIFSSPLDGRPLFLVKHDGCFLYGTSDDWTGGSPDEPAPGEADVTYLLESLRAFMPEAGLDEAKIRYAYSGFRPLLSPARGDANASLASREDHVEVSRGGLVTVVGGKLTTARRMAERLLDRLCDRLGPEPGWGPCRTRELSIGGSNEAVAEAFARWTRACPRQTKTFRVLFRRYGLDAEAVAEAIVRLDRDGGRSEEAAHEVELRHACEREMACTVEDLLERRVGRLAWTPATRITRARGNRASICRLLGLSHRQFDEQVAAYAEALRRCHTVPQARADMHALAS